MKLDWADPESWAEVPKEDRAAIVKSAVTMPEVAELCGYDVAAGDKIRPPWNPTERTPSTHLYEDHFYDYGSGRYGDIFDFIRECDVAADEGDPRSLPAAVEYIRKLALQGGKEPGDVERVPVRKLEDLSGHIFAEGMIPWDFMGYGTTPYGVMLDVHTNDVYVPHWEYTNPGIRVYGIKIRRYKGGKKDAVPGSQFTHRLYDPFGWPDRSRSDDWSCIITEGESDCWAMKRALAPVMVDVFALPSGAGAWKDAWLEDLKPYSTIHLCFDNDRAGKQALDKVTRKVGFDRAKELRVPALYNDAREALAAGWEPRL